jgi:peptidoglycan/LPS O-acetylase OafA/YrhL
VSSPSSFPALTSLRFIAALLVFLFHFPPHGAVFDIVAREGHVGVNIFFVLSGFLITLRYSEGLARGTVSIGDYFLRRAARILPLYYVVLAASVPFTHAAGLFSLARLPEWTLTQGLFRNGVGDLAVPTSWSLTVEECFYALAPILFLAIAASGRRWPRARLTSGIAVTAAATLLLYGIGAVIWTSLDGRGPGFLSTAIEVSRNTVFGRFYDFACGVTAALALQTPRFRWRAALLRRLPSASASLLAAGLIVFAQWRMHIAGGIYGPDWLRIYLWHLLIAPAAALLIVSLTSAANPIVGVLSCAPFEYLGKVSYALYLLQATELAKSAFYRLLPDDMWWSWLALYMGMTIVCIALYELVEEPGRRLVLRVFARERKPAEPLLSGRARWCAACVLAIATIIVGTAWTVRSLRAQHGPVALAEVETIGVPGHDVLRVGRDELDPGKGWSVKIPRRWRQGWREDDRAPMGLRVFVDGTPVPFSYREPASTDAAAFFRDPRSSFLALRLSAQPQQVVVVNDSVRLTTTIFVHRLRSSSMHAVAFGGSVLAAVAIFWVVMRRPRHTPLAGKVALDRPA